eukprot:gene8468-4829_t
MEPTESSHETMDDIAVLLDKLCVVVSKDRVGGSEKLTSPDNEEVDVEQSTQPFIPSQESSLPGGAKGPRQPPAIRAGEEAVESTDLFAPPPDDSGQPAIAARRGSVDFGAELTTSLPEASADVWFGQMYPGGRSKVPGKRSGASRRRKAKIYQALAAISSTQSELRKQSTSETGEASFEAEASFASFPPPSAAAAAAINQARMLLMSNGEMTRDLDMATATAVLGPLAESWSQLLPIASCHATPPIPSESTASSQGYRGSSNPCQLELATIANSMSSSIGRSHSYGNRSMRPLGGQPAMLGEQPDVGGQPALPAQYLPMYHTNNVPGRGYTRSDASFNSSTSTGSGRFAFHSDNMALLTSGDGQGDTFQRVMPDRVVNQRNMLQQQVPNQVLLGLRHQQQLQQQEQQQEQHLIDLIQHQKNLLQMGAGSVLDQRAAVVAANAQHMMSQRHQPLMPDLDPQLDPSRVQVGPAVPRGMYHAPDLSCKTLQQAAAQVHDRSPGSNVNSASLGVSPMDPFVYPTQQHFQSAEGFARGGSLPPEDDIVARCFSSEANVANNPTMCNASDFTGLNGNSGSFMLEENDPRSGGSDSSMGYAPMCEVANSYVGPIYLCPCTQHSSYVLGGQQL